MVRSLSTIVRRSIVAVALVSLPLAHALAQAPMGPPGGAPPLVVILLDDSLHQSLALTATQEALWQTLQDDEENLHAQMTTSRQAVKTAVATELAKPTPDLVLIEAVVASAQDAAAAGTKHLQSEALALYTSLTPVQQAAVIAVVKAAYQRHANSPLAGAVPPGRH